MQQPQRIILRAPNWLGDHIMAQETYRSIRAVFPDSHLVVFLPEQLKGLLPAGIFNEEWGFKKNQLRNSQLVAELVQKRFDLSINLNASWSSALLFYRARIPFRLGFSESGSGILSTSSIPWTGVKSGIHKAQLYTRILRLVGAHEPREEVKPKTGSFPAPEPSYWVIAPEASIPLREWPYFPELLLELKTKYPHQVIKVVGTNSNGVWKSRLARWNLPGVEDHIGKTSLAELKQLCSGSQLVIANDSGVAHLGATIAQVPTVVIFGPGNPHYIAPQGPAVFAVRAEGIQCSPCEKAYCGEKFGYQTCLKEIASNSVLNTIEKALSL